MAKENTRNYLAYGSIAVAFLSLCVSSAVLYFSHLKKGSLEVDLSPNITIAAYARAPAITATFGFLNSDSVHAVINWVELEVADNKTGTGYRLIPAYFLSQEVSKESDVTSTSGWRMQQQVHQMPFSTILIAPKSSTAVCLFFHPTNIDQQFTFTPGAYEIKAHYYRGNLETEAIKVRDSVQVTMTDRFAEYLEYGGIAALRAGPWERVKGSYVAPPITDSWKAQSLANWAENLLQLGLFPDAKQKLEKALTLATDRGILEARLGNVLLVWWQIENKPQLLEEARQHLENAIRLRPLDSEPRRFIAQVLMEMGENDAAVKSLQEALAQGYFPEFTFGTTFWKLQNHPGFQEILRETHKSDFEKGFEKAYQKARELRESQPARPESKQNVDPTTGERTTTDNHK